MTFRNLNINSNSNKPTFLTFFNNKRMNKNADKYMVLVSKIQLIKKK